MTFDPAAWAGEAASEIVERFSDSDVETADYRLCSFIIAAAKLAVHDAGFAEKIGLLMEPPRQPKSAHEQSKENFLREAHKSARDALDRAVSARIPRDP